MLSLISNSFDPKPRQQRLACCQRFGIAVGMTTRCLVCLILLASLTGCQKFNVNTIKDRLTPSNNRDWQPELATVPSAIIDGPQYTLRNIRNSNYLTDQDYVVDYYDRQISIDQIQSVDFIVVPFNSCLLYTSPSPRDLSTSRMPSSA